MANTHVKAAKAKAKADTFVRKQKAKAMSDAKTKAKQAAIEAMADEAKAKPALEIIEGGKTVHAASTSIDAGRYKVSDAQYGFEVQDGMATAKPSAASYRVDKHHIELAQIFATGDSKAITEQFNEIGTAIANTTGKVACACAGLAYRLQASPKEGRADVVDMINDFLAALEPLGKSISGFRVNAVRSWFEAFASVVWKKSETKGEGQKMHFDQAKFEKEATKFGRDKDAWLVKRIAKPFNLFKPEPELKSFDLMAAIGDLLKRAEKLKPSAANKTEMQKAGYKTINLDGLDGLKASIKRLKNKLEAENETEETKEETSDTKEETKAA